MDPRRLLAPVAAVLVALPLLGAAVVVDRFSDGAEWRWRGVPERPEPVPMTDEQYATLEPTATYDASLDDMTEDEEGWQVATGDESGMGPMVNDGELPPDGPPAWLDEPAQP